MSSKFRLIILTAFFCAVAIVGVSRVLRSLPTDPQLQADRIALQREKFIVQREHVRRNADAWFYGVVGFAGVFGASGLIVATGMHRAQVKQAQVHTYKIGESTVVIHERDLSLAAPVAMGLINAEHLKQMNGGMEKAFELSCRMADLQNRQIRALTHGRLALPEKTASEPEPHQASSPIPTFRELLQQGQIGPQTPLVFGFANNHRIRTGTWQEIYSNATGGQSGSGKTNTLLSLIGQSVIQGIQFWIIDYHWPHDESLLAKLGPVRDSGAIRYAKKPIDVRPVLEEVNACLDRRLQKQEPSAPIRVLCIDEVLCIVKNCPYTEEMIERIGMEGRKVNVFGLFAAQSWKADKVDTTARDNLTSIFAHYMKPNQAKLLLQDSDRERLLKKLHRGQMVFCPVMGEPEILTVPRVSPDDMSLVSKLVNPSTVDQAVDQPVDCPSPLPGLDDAGRVDLVDRINNHLQQPGDFNALAQSTQLDKSYLSRILRRKQAMSKNAEARLMDWLAKR
jgi:hypothetical protein